MSEVLESQAILDLISVLKREGPTETLLEEALPVIARHLSGQPSLRVYRLSDDTVSLWAATPPFDFAAAPLHDAPALAGALDGSTPVIDGSRWLAPLRSGDHSLGALEVEFGAATPPTMPDWLRIASHELAAALALGTMRDLMQRQMSEAQRRAEQLQVIAAFSQSIQATLDEEAIFQVALTQSVRMIPLDFMGIYMYDSTRGQLHVVGQYDEGKNSVTLHGGSLVSREQTTAGHVWEARALLHIPDLQQEPSLRHPFKTDLRSLVVAPILSRGLMLGMVEAGCRTPNVYSETDLIVFQQMVSQLAVALENAEVYAQSQKLAKNKALVSEITAQLQQQMDIESILGVTVSELGKALGARRGRIRLARPDSSNVS